MQKRPTSLLGLTAHYAKMKWAAMSTSSKLVLVAAVFLGGMFAASAATCMLGSGSCPASGGCPYSGGAAAAPSSPCGN